MAATLWYLILSSVLMVGQYFLERRFGRGFGTSPKAKAQPGTVPTASGLTVTGNK